jgi:guanine nucleotide-binding protein subunit alpha
LLTTTANLWPHNTTMCFGARNKNEDGEAQSRELDKVLRQDEKRMAKEVKLLLLGKS